MCKYNRIENESIAVGMLYRGDALFIAVLFPAAAARLRLLKFGTFKFFRNGGKNMGFEQGAYGARIKQLRIGKGLTQEQLAEKMNVTGTYIVKIENGQRTGSVELAVELAACFGVSLDYLCWAESTATKSGLSRP